MLLKKLKTRKMMLFMVFKEIPYATQTILLRRKMGAVKNHFIILIFYSPLLEHFFYDPFSV